jgi:cobalt-zinc-cadmium efflux system outer membrane protein
MIRVFVAAVTALLCGVPSVARAQTALTLQDVIARARDQSGAVALARARAAEAEAAAVAAAVRYRDNPVLDLSAGPRRTGAGRAADVDIGLSQQFETGGQRRARTDAAAAAVARSQAANGQAARDSAFRAASAFLRALAAAERTRMAAAAAAVSGVVLAATERRYTAGDVAAIDLNLARIERARAGGALRAAQADAVAAAGELGAILRLPSGEALDLRGALDSEPVPAVDTLRQSIAARADFAALEAETREAEAELRLGRALRRPDVGVRIGYEREGADTVVLGGLTVTLPAFERGQGVTAAAAAKRSRVGLELELGHQAALAALDAALAVHAQRVQAVQELASQALPALNDNESLATASYDAGELRLLELLLIRRDALETRSLLIDRQLDAALSRLDIDYLSGVMR